MALSYFTLSSTACDRTAAIYFYLCMSFSSGKIISLQGSLLHQMETVLSEYLIKKKKKPVNQLRNLNSSFTVFFIALTYISLTPAALHTSPLFSSLPPLRYKQIQISVWVKRQAGVTHSKPQSCPKRPINPISTISPTECMHSFQLDQVQISHIFLSRPYISLPTM